MMLGISGCAENPHKRSLPAQILLAIILHVILGGDMRNPRRRACVWAGTLPPRFPASSSPR
jgi:hypothetical protein